MKTLSSSELRCFTTYRADCDDSYARSAQELHGKEHFFSSPERGLVRRTLPARQDAPSVQK